ncbi:hypothetical protein SDC9_184927 [bioreactor metagenome]|uniref:Uncharacterized protein n=1 Tax=bioreactor metagenome TaxID=1076179 RepID=A0A645HF91_9ZZZZ
MPHGDPAARHALGAGQLDIILVDLIHHVAAQPHRVIGDGPQRHGDDRQYPGDRLRIIKQHGDIHRAGTV